MGGNQVQSGLTVDLAQLQRGVPLHVWNSETFLKIGQTWGDVVLIADDTIKGLSFSVGKVLISTNKGNEADKRYYGFG